MQQDRVLVQGWPKQNGYSMLMHCPGSAFLLQARHYGSQWTVHVQSCKTAHAGCFRLQCPVRS